MKRMVFGGIAVVLAIAAVFVVTRRDAARGASASRSTVPPAAADSVWYHASDVALLATTGRPQLVEFFHPD